MKALMILIATITALSNSAFGQRINDYTLEGQALYSLDRMPRAIENGMQKISELIENVTDCSDITLYYEITDGFPANQYKIFVSSNCLHSNEINKIELDYFKFYGNYPDARDLAEIELGFTLVYKDYSVKIESRNE